ncbi:VCBS repeat-containing protein, partial [candidate division KSB1 bacterium]|nr:VCBS repeat-containing protein [candidate division KSB1 bacterium]
GDLDLFIAVTAQHVLYRNDGDAFVDVGTEMGFVDTTAGYATGAVWADIDNDNDLDLFNMNAGVKLFKNEGDTFVDISVASGLDLFDPTLQLWAMSCGDFDQDGDLDVTYSGEDGGGLPARLLINEEGVFTDQALAIMGAEYQFEAWSPNFLDYDNDGDLDVWMPTIRTPGQASGLFENIAGELWDVTEDKDIIANAAIASSWADFDNDLDLDLFLVTWTGGGTGENDMFYQNDGEFFTDIAPDQGMEGPIGDSRGMGWGDFDNDGDQDLLVGSSGEQKLYRNDDGAFTEVGAETGVGVTLSECRNVMMVDYDADGFLDIYLNSNDKMLLHNDGNDNNFIGFRPRASGSSDNGSGLGTRFRIVIGEQNQIRDIECGGMGGLRHGHTWAHFGVGEATTVDSVIIRWPTGNVDTYTDVPVGGYYLSEEGVGIGTAVDNPKKPAIRPETHALLQNFPNPFNPTTIIPFKLDKDSRVNLTLYNTLGETVKELAAGQFNAGYHEIALDANTLPAGMYMYKLEANGITEMKKMMLIK